MTFNLAIGNSVRISGSRVFSPRSTDALVRPRLADVSTRFGANYIEQRQAASARRGIIAKTFLLLAVATGTFFGVRGCNSYLEDKAQIKATSEGAARDSRDAGVTNDPWNRHDSGATDNTTPRGDGGVTDDTTPRGDGSTPGGATEHRPRTRRGSAVDRSLIGVIPRAITDPAERQRIDALNDGHLPLKDTPKFEELRGYLGMPKK